MKYCIGLDHHRFGFGMHNDRADKTVKETTYENAAEGDKTENNINNREESKTVHDNYSDHDGRHRQLPLPLHPEEGWRTEQLLGMMEERTLDKLGASELELFNLLCSE